jgi:hypothetical protein
MFGLVRYNAGGTLDSTFGGDGRVTTNLTADSDIATGIAIQADGMIVRSQPPRRLPNFSAAGEG